ncbi:CHAT domain-containing protein [Aquibium carbonis]|uniref:CHAT domain-containing protein n=1 Tax=Aquibium carbonis TaxID=2495581 RepID=A0A429Z242_9HYPH|nr:CHAT domain-containing protein [Aquibium carbonis]RST87776.1 CHAT domain-containing protein [Aquibium carbonis]
MIALMRAMALFGLLLFPSWLLAQPAEPDEKLAAWRTQFIDRQIDELISETESDILSDAMHPYAPEIWSRVKYASGELTEDWRNRAPDGLADRLGTFPDLFLAFAEGDDARGMALALAVMPGAEPVRDTYKLAMWQASDRQHEADMTLARIEAGDRTFHPLWQLLFDVDQLRATRARAEQLIEAETEDDLWRDTARAILEGAAAMPRSRQLALVNRWLEARPDDQGALHFKAQMVDQARDWPQALAMLRKLTELYPFASYVEATARIAVRFEPEDAVRAELRTRLLATTPLRAEALDMEIERILADAYRRADDRGAARRIARAALERWPDGVRLHSVMAQIEIDSKRMAEAAPYARKAAAAPKASLDDLANLIGIEAGAGDGAGLEAVMTRFAERFGRPSQDAFYRAAALYETGSPEAIDHFREAVEAHPSSEWMMRNLVHHLVKGKVSADDADVIDDWIDRFESPSHGTSLYLEHLRAVETPERALAQYRRMAARWGAYEDYWKPLGDEHTTNDARLAFWHDVRARHPDRAFPVRTIAELHRKTRRWDDVFATLEEARSSMTGIMGSELDRVLFEHCYLVSVFMQEGGAADQALYDRARADCEEAIRLGENQGEVARQFSRLSSTFGDKSRMVADWKAAVRLQPDWAAAMTDGFYGGLAKTLNRRHVFAALHRWYERDPYDGVRMAEIADRHSKWGGSGIWAKILFERMKEVAPDVFRDKESLYHHVSKGFESDSDNFVKQYGREKYLSHSLRYVGWFETARQKAQGNSPIVQVDAATVTKTTLFPDGQRHVETDDPVTGAPVLRQRGRGWQRFDYDDRGNLTSVERSDGRAILFGYDEADRIVRFVTSDESELTLEYNDDGQPVLIILEGTGRLSVRYDGAGNIEKVEADDGDTTTALKITQAFQEILAITRQVDSNASVVDPAFERELEQLIGDVRDFRDDPTNALLLNRLEALVSKVDGTGEAFRTAEDRLFDILSARPKPEIGLRALALLHRLYATTFPAGLDEQHWDYWREARDLLPAGALDGDDALAREIRARPLALLAQARWLPRSDLSNPGYWATYDMSTYAPKPLRERLRARTLHATQDGRVLLASNDGLFIRKDGFWLRHLVDLRAGALVEAAPDRKASAVSDVLSIADAGDGALWLGTADGLYRVDQMGAVVARFRSASDGLAARRVAVLAPWRGGVIAAGQGGLSFFDGEGPSPDLLERFGAEALLADAEPVFVTPVSDDELLVGVNAGLWWLRAGGPPERLADLDVRAAHVLSDGSVAIAAGTDLLTLDRQADGGFSPLRRVEGQQDMQVARSLYGLASIQAIEDEPDALAVLTDLGISIHHRGYFEHLNLPHTLRQAPALAMAMAGGSLWILSDDGRLHAFERGQALVDKRGPVRHLVTDAEGRVTYFARGSGMHARLHDGEIEPQYLFGARVTAMIPAPGGMLFNDGSDIMRYRTGDAYPELLFSARNDTEAYDAPEARESRNNEVTGIALGTDGAVWATTRTSVFRHVDGETREFSWFLDRAAFPMPTDWIAGVHVTFDGRVWVIGSNEKHIQIGGSQMSGGVAQWNGETFDRAGTEDDLWARPWFITSYTQIGEGRAILGTTGGMGLHETGRFTYVEGIDEPSYQALLEAHPNLFLGGRGAAIGDDIWLFPTAAGIIGHHAGRWFYPERINQLLPDSHLARYGAKVVHAVETDGEGRIYAGTDRGLLIFDTGGAGAESFLFASGLGDEAFRIQEEENLRRQRQIFINGLDGDDPRAKLARRYLELEAEVSRLSVAEKMIDRAPLVERLAPRPTERSNDEPTAREPADSAERIRTLVTQRERQMSRLLLQLERDSEALAQTLQMKPLDLAALQKDIPDGAAMVQYIPTTKTLYVHLVSRQERHVREVQVETRALFERARKARRLLEARAAGLLQGERSGASLRKEVLSPVTVEERDRELFDLLHDLYRTLILPVAHELGSYDHVFIVPAGALAEVPFAGLISERGERNRFVVQDHTIGLMPSLYLVHLFLSHVGSASDQMLILGDPDGSLPGARREAKAIEERTSLFAETRIGDEADYDAFLQMGPESKAVHLATHGVLDAARPEESYILLSGNRKLKLVDIQLLDFANTDMVFLSACETGLGGQGVEFQTLSRAFAHAGVPTVAATLWKVNDLASLELATRFYEHYEDDALAAMAAAQRGMIEEGVFAHPAAWAGYMTIGMP